MKFHHEEKVYDSSGKTDIIDLSSDLMDFVRQSGITNGHVTVMAPGATAAVTTIEFESGVLDDLRQAIHRLVPQDIPYSHDRRWGDGNGYSHVRAALMGPSVTVPVISGKLILGTWQQVICIDFDNRPRDRRVMFHLIGE